MRNQKKKEICLLKKYKKDLFILEVLSDVHFDKEEL